MSAFIEFPAVKEELRMKVFFRIAVGLAVLTVCVLPVSAQDEASAVKMSTLKMGPLPVFPSCVTLAPTHGDPFKGAATIAIKPRVVARFHGTGTQPAKA